MEEGKILDVEVKIIWSETVKPLYPTPNNLKTRRLSILDQLVVQFHVPTLIFYSASESSSDQLLDKMKTSLSVTLSQFYPLAGRLLDESTILCNDQGVPFIYAKVNCSLSSVKSIYMDNDHGDQKSLIDKLLPPKELLHGYHKHLPIPISAWAQLAFQVNVFQCGGVVIGSYMSHKQMDGISATTFLEHWASLCQGLGRPELLVQPDFDAIVAAFPPYEQKEEGTILQVTDHETKELRDEQQDEVTILQGTDHETKELRDEQQQDEGTLQATYTTTATTTTSTTTTATVRCFVFNSTATSAIREKAASERTPNPTRVESVTGFLWKYCMEAQEQMGPTDLVLSVDMRSRARPPIPRNSMGNLATNVVARAEKNELGVADLVEEIRGVINELNHERVADFQGEKGAEALWQRGREHNIAQQQSSSNTYIVTCQCRGGFTDADFGFGKPILIYPFVGFLPTMPTHHFFVLVDHIDAIQGNGIQAWLTLDKKLMQGLETNPDFLAFASPLDLNLLA